MHDVIENGVSFFIVNCIGPSAGPANLRVQEIISPQEILFAWDPVPCDKRNGKILGHRIVVYQKRSKLYDKTEHIPDQNAFKLTADLPCKHTYTLYVAALNRAGVGVFSNFSFGPDWIKRSKTIKFQLRLHYLNNTTSFVYSIVCIASRIGLFL